MELNHIALSLIYMTSFVVIRQASCIPSKFIIPTIPLISDALSPISEIESSISVSKSSLISPTSSSSPLALPHSSITSLIDDLKNSHLKIPKKVIEACKKTDHPSECSASVTPLLDGNFEPISVLQGESKAFDHALQVATEDMSNVWSVGDDDQTISTCKQMYDNAREEIAKAMELATNDDKYGVNIHLSAALSFIGTCKDEIPKDINDDSTLVITNNFLSNLASNCLALGDFAMGLDHHDY